MARETHLVRPGRGHQCDFEAPGPACRMSGTCWAREGTELKRPSDWITNCEESEGARDI